MSQPMYGMLVSVSIGTGFGTKKDDDESRTTTLRNATREDSARVVKDLFKGGIHGSIKSKATMARNYVADNTHEYFGSMRLLAAENPEFVENFIKRLGEYKDEFEQLVEKLCMNLDEVIKEQETRLGGLFRREDYPDDHELRRGFSFEIFTAPLPVPSDCPNPLAKMGAEFQKEQDERISAMAEEVRIKSAVNCVEKIREKAETLLSAMKDWKSGEKKFFKANGIMNLLEIAELVETSLNISHDPRVTQAVERVRSTFEIFGTDSEVIEGLCEEVRKNEDSAGYLMSEVEKMVSDLAGIEF